MVVTAPSLEVQEAMNHVEQMQQAVQTYQTMMGVKQGIEKTVDAVEKVNSKLATVREVQEIATRSAACVKRIQQVYAKISAMKVDRRYTTNLLSLCSQTTRECVNITAYGAKIFTSNFLRMSDAGPRQHRQAPGACQLHQPPGGCREVQQPVIERLFQVI